MIEENKSNYPNHIRRLNKEEQDSLRQKNKEILEKDFISLFEKHNKILRQPYVLMYIKEFINKMKENGAWEKFE